MGYKTLIVFLRSSNAEGDSVACLQSDKLATEICAGIGFLSEGLLQNGLRIIAVDQSEIILNETKSKFIGIDGINYSFCKTEGLPI